MPRPKKWPPTIYPHKRSGRDRIRVNGHDHWLGPSGSEESRREYARLVVELAEGAAAPSDRPHPRAGLTVEQAVSYWEKHESGRLAPKEARHYRRALSVLVCVCGGEPAADFDSARLEDVRTAMTTASWMGAEQLAYFARWNREPRWSARVANRQVSRIRTAWRFLERRKQVPRGSWGELRLLPGLDARDARVRHRPRVRPATLEDLEAVCARIRSRTTRAMLKLQWLTGMRSGEVRRMKGGEIDATGPVWLYRPSKHKNQWRGQDRVIPLGPEAQKIVGPRLKACREGHVFVNEKGRPYTSNAYGLAFGRAAKKCGREHLRPYSLRHGAKQRITRELGLDAARAVLGQASLTTTNLYAAGADLEQAVDAAARLG